MKIITDENLLRKECFPVNQEDRNTIEIFTRKMVRAMLMSGGIGMAAPQLGLYKRLFIIQVKNNIKVFINPNILSLSNEKEMKVERCLSIRNTKALVSRSKEIEIKYFDGIKYKTELYRGFLARTIQHEYEHLDGILYIDKPGVIKEKDNRVISKYRKVSNIIFKIPILFKIKDINIKLVSLGGELNERIITK